MWRQRNVSQIKEQNKIPEKELSRGESASNAALAGWPFKGPRVSEAQAGTTWRIVPLEQCPALILCSYAEGREWSAVPGVQWEGGNLPVSVSQPADPTECSHWEYDMEAER